MVNDTSYPTIIESVLYCPHCRSAIEELDCTTFYCDSCHSQWQIEGEIPDYYFNDSSPTTNIKEKTYGK